MALLLAPYNDAMRLGMGFNSYTQTMCIDQAVEIKDSKGEEKKPSQVVTYSSKLVERLSDVVSSMHISYSSAIKKGTIEVSGNGNSIDEDKIKSSDINLVVSVQVINQTTIVASTPTFKPIDNLTAGSTAFNDVFGDCYISGFIEGGDFTSIISMRCLDRTNTSGTVKVIKRMTQASESDEFSMDAYNFSASISNTDAMKDTETTISVNWKGGGQIKDPETSWDIASVYKAAAAFPDQVAKTPQRTWAILTKYKANRSFSDWAISNSLSPLEYDAVVSYTTELFNSFMEYKQLVKKVQDIISHRDDYVATLKDDAIPTDIPTLVAVRQALRNEMNKIVTVVNVLSRHPGALQQNSSLDLIPKNDLVGRIMKKAIPAGTAVKPTLAASSSPVSIASTSEPAELASTDPANPAPNTKVTAKPKDDNVKLDLSQLIAPEIWADLLPIRTATSVIQDTDASSRAAAIAALSFPAAPTTDPPPAPASAPAPTKAIPVSTPVKLTIHRAVCGIHDVTDTLRSRIVNDRELSIQYSEIDNLAQSPIYAKFPITFRKNLSMIYQYSGGPLRWFTMNDIAGTTGAESIDYEEEVRQQEEDDPYTRLDPSAWNAQTWSLVAVFYGGKLFKEDSELDAVEEVIRKDFQGSTTGTRRVNFSNSLFGKDPWNGVTKTGVIYYLAEAYGDDTIRAAVGIEGVSPASLTAQLQLANSESFADFSSK